MTACPVPPSRRAATLREARVTASTTCPRCGGALQPPGLWSSEWRCERHGAVLPLHVAKVPSLRVLRGMTGQARVPAWMPHPLPVSWVITGIAHVGDERSGVRGTALLCSGPSPLGGPGGHGVGRRGARGGTGRPPGWTARSRSRPAQWSCRGETLGCRPSHGACGQRPPDRRTGSRTPERLVAAGCGRCCGPNRRVCCCSRTYGSRT